MNDRKADEEYGKLVSRVEEATEDNSLNKNDIVLKIKSSIFPFSFIIGIIIIIIIKLLSSTVQQDLHHLTSTEKKS